MSIVYKARVTLIRTAKVFPFILCFIVCISYTESMYALLMKNYCMLDDSITLYKPISWFVGNIFLYEWYAIIMATILSFAMETCWANKASIIYLCVNAWERDYFLTIELYPEYVYAICIANIIVSGFFVWKGIKILCSKC